MARKPSLTWITEYWEAPLKTLLSLEVGEVARMAESIQRAGVAASRDAFVEFVSRKLIPIMANDFSPWFACLSIWR